MVNVRQRLAPAGAFAFGVSSATYGPSFPRRREPTSPSRFGTGERGKTVNGEEALLKDLRERIRDVRQGPDGAIWLLTDDPQGRVLRVVPGP